MLRQAMALVFLAWEGLAACTAALPQDPEQDSRTKKTDGGAGGGGY